MKLYIVFGQRECRYEGQYAPEAVGVVDEWCLESNQDALNEIVIEARRNKEFIAVEVVVVDIGQKGQDAIAARLNKPLTLTASVEE